MKVSHNLINISTVKSANITNMEENYYIDATEFLNCQQIYNGGDDDNKDANILYAGSMFASNGHQIPSYMFHTQSQLQPPPPPPTTTMFNQEQTATAPAVPNQMIYKYQQPQVQPQSTMALPWFAMAPNPPGPIPAPSNMSSTTLMQKPTNTRVRYF